MRTCAKLTLIMVLMFSLSSCRTRLAEGTLRSQHELQTFEVVPNPARLDDIRIPSFPLRVAAKFVLSGIRLDGDPSSPELKYARFLQMLEYLDHYARLSPSPLGSGTPQLGAPPTYRDWLRVEHQNLPPFARFQREMRALVKDPEVLDPQKALREVITPVAGRAELPVAGSEARRMMTTARNHLTEWMREARVNEKTAGFLSAEFLRAPREFQKGAKGLIQMVGLSALVSPLFQVSDLFLEAVEQGMTAAIKPLTPEFTLDDAENLLFGLARLRGVIRFQRDWVVSVMTEAENAMRSTRAAAQELVKLQIDSGYFRSEDPSTSLLLSLMIGGYIKSLPEAQAQDIFSDLIDSASPELTQRDVLEAALRNAGPLAKKTLQLFADAEGLSPEVKAVLDNLLASNEAMDFSLVTRALSDREASSLNIVRVHERPLGVGSLADVYRIDVKPDASFLASRASEIGQSEPTLTASAIELEWQAQACLAAASGNTLTNVLKELSRQPKSTAQDVIAVCEKNGLDAKRLLKDRSTPEWIRDAVQSQTLPLAVRILKPETEEYLATEQTIMADIIAQYDRAMDEDEKAQLAEKNHISHYRPRLGNILNAYVDLIKEELNTELTLKRQRLAGTTTSSYESVVADQAGPFLLRTRVPRIAPLPQSEQSPMMGRAVVQEFLPGGDYVRTASRLQIENSVRKRAAQELLKIWLRGALYDETRLVHADLHRGNILTSVLGAGRPEGSASRPIIQVALIDFGMAVDTTGTEMTEFSYDIINLGIGADRRDIDRVLRALRSLADLGSDQNTPASYAAQRKKAEAFLKTYQDPDGKNSPPPIDVWFSWAKDQLPLELRLRFPTYVLNLIRGYLTINSLYSSEGATEWDAVRINLDLALEPGNLSKIWQAYRTSKSSDQGTSPQNFGTEKDLGDDLRAKGTR